MCNSYKCFKSTAEVYFKSNDKKKKFKNLIMFIFFKLHELFRTLIKILHESLYKCINA